MVNNKELHVEVNYYKDEVKMLPQQNKNAHISLVTETGCQLTAKMEPAPQQYDNINWLHTMCPCGALGETNIH